MLLCHSRRQIHEVRQFLIGGNRVIGENRLEPASEQLQIGRASRFAPPRR